MNATFQGRYFPLLVALSVLGCLYPALESRTGSFIWTATFWLVLMGAIRALSQHARVRNVAAGLSVLAIGCGIWFLAMGGGPTEHPTALTLLSLANLSFLLLATIVILVDVLSGEQVDVDKMIGAVCVYILIGITFAYLFLTTHALALHWAPDDVMVQGVGPSLLSSYLYFSFATMTTLGYGDLAPVNDFTRLFASVEAVSGQLYLTILVARLVGLHISQRPTSES